MSVFWHWWHIFAKFEVLPGLKVATDTHCGRHQLCSGCSPGSALLLFPVWYRLDRPLNACLVNVKSDPYIHWIAFSNQRCREQCSHEFLVYALLLNKVPRNSVVASSLRFVRRLTGGIFYPCGEPHYLKRVVFYSLQFFVQGLKLPEHTPI